VIDGATSFPGWCRGWESNPHDPFGSRDLSPSLALRNAPDFRFLEVLFQKRGGVGLSCIATGGVYHIPFTVCRAAFQIFTQHRAIDDVTRTSAQRIVRGSGRRLQEPSDGNG
jgi:hypothetical protein